MRSNRATASTSWSLPVSLISLSSSRIFPGIPSILLGGNHAQPRCRHKPTWFSGTSSAGLETTGCFGGAGRWLHALACCFPGTLEALVHLTCDITTCVWGADLFKPAWLAAATQVTSPRCRARDSHLTLLSGKRTHCLRAERGKWSLLCGFLTLRTPSHLSSPLCPTYSHIYVPVGAVRSLFIICFHLMISVILPQEYPYALCKSY